ncbi:MAG: hypothetical protein JNL74_03905 [Fibrobacteres bacterium]|nr:hypothetical protein [Fibrobacterota bacterium]
MKFPIKLSILTFTVAVFNIELFALTYYPLKISVDMDSSIVFSPAFKGNVSLINVSAEQPKHGKLLVVPSNVPYNGRSVSWFNYTPDPSFLGRDSFYWRLSESEPTQVCRLMVHPLEPVGMTILIVVNDSMYTDISNSLSIFMRDLENEGYVPKIKLFPNALKVTDRQGANSRALWDTVSKEYDLVDQYLAGVILFGILPTDAYLWNLAHPFSRGNSFDLDTAKLSFCDTSLYGFTMADNSKQNARNIYSVFPNTNQIWVSSFYNTSSNAIIAALNTNHEYRTGIARSPHSAAWYDLFFSYATGGVTPQQRKKEIDTTNWSIAWKDVNYSKDLLEGFATECEFFDSHENIFIPYTFSRPRVILDIFCGKGTFTNGYGKTNDLLYKNNSATVLCIGTPGYGDPRFSFSDTVLEKKVFLKRLANGECWGSAWRKSKLQPISLNFFGDLSIRPKVSPNNIAPHSTFTADKYFGHAPLNIEFSANASDLDGHISSVEWYSSFVRGEMVPDWRGMGVVGKKITHIYTKPYKYRSVLAVMDNYKAWKYSRTSIAVYPDTTIPFRVYSTYSRLGPTLNSFTTKDTLTWFSEDFSSYEKIDVYGNVWYPSLEYSFGSWGSSSSSKGKTNEMGVVNGAVVDTFFYRTWTKSYFSDQPLKYFIPWSNGKCSIAIGFADFSSNGTDSLTVMDVDINGNRIASGFSPNQIAGRGNAAHIKTSIEVSNHMVEFTFTRNSASRGPLDKTRPFFNWLTIFPLMSSTMISTKQKDFNSENIVLRPNPFNPGTLIDCSIYKNSEKPIVITVFNSRGQNIYTMTMSPNSSQIYWQGCDNNGCQVATGVYTFRVSSGKQHKLIRGIVIR